MPKLQKPITTSRQCAVLSQNLSRILNFVVTLRLQVAVADPVRAMRVWLHLFLTLTSGDNDDALKEEKTPKKKITEKTDSDNETKKAEAKDTRKRKRSSSTGPAKKKAKKDTPAKKKKSYSYMPKFHRDKERFYQISNDVCLSDLATHSW